MILKSALTVRVDMASTPSNESLNFLNLDTYLNGEFYVGAAVNKLTTSLFLASADKSVLGMCESLTENLSECGPDSCRKPEYLSARHTIDGTRKQ
jgi:hypothetical protein